MYYVVFVAVVDTRKYLLKEHCSIPLTEFAALEHLVKQLATFTNLSYEVVTLFIFEELVHLHDVWVILRFVRGLILSIFQVKVWN